MARVVTGSSDKGGVCKTTSAHNLSACLAEKRNRTLQVDVTAQGNLTFANKLRPPNKTLWHHFRHDVPISEIMVQPYEELPDLWLVPSDAGLAEVARGNTDYLALYRALQPVLSEFDFVVADPPGDTWNWNAMSCYSMADDVIITTPPGVFEVTGASNVAQVLSEVHKNINPRLRLSKLLITKWEKSGMASQLVDVLHSMFTDPRDDDDLGEALKVLYEHDELGLTRNNPLFRTRIRQSREYPNDQALGLPAILSGNKLGAEDYRNFCNEFLVYCQLRPMRVG